MAERKDKHFIKKPVYPGGNAAFKKFITDNLKYPETALKNKVEGTVVIKYSINYKGEVIDTRVVKSVGHGCDEEALRLIKSLKFEVPKEPRKLRVKFNKETKIHFRLPKKKVTSKEQGQFKTQAQAQNKTQAQLQYNYVPKKNKQAAIKKPSTTYSYTIDIK